MFEQKSPYSEWFVNLYEKITVRSIFQHKMYRAGQPVKILLNAQCLITDLLNHSFLTKYQVKNGCLKKYENVERINSMTKQDIVDACASYRPYGEPLPLDEYILGRDYMAGYSRLIDDIINPGYQEAKKAIYFPQETEVEKNLPKDVYTKCLQLLGYVDNMTTRRRLYTLYLYWLPKKDCIWRFSENTSQKKFDYLLNLWAVYTEKMPKEIAYNAFGIISGKFFNNFVDFCVKNGYYLVYNESSWVLPWNRREE